jgi:hypothetical protein
MKKEKAIKIPVDKEALEKTNENESKVRLQQFVQELRILQEKYKVEIFAVNQVQDNGEVIPTVKLIDTYKKV